MLHDTLELDWFVLTLHGCRVQAVSSVLELNNEAFRVPHGQVILRAQVLQRLRSSQDHSNQL